MSIANGQNNDSEYIDLAYILSKLWEGKWIIIAFIFLIGSVGLYFSVTLPDQYSATVVVKPVEQNDQNSLSSLSSRFSGVASLAGINLSESAISESTVAIEIINGWPFIEGFIKRYDLEAKLLASQGWDKDTGKLIYDETKYNVTDSKWLVSNKNDDDVFPTSWELYEEFIERLNVRIDKKTGLINVSFRHYSPSLSKEVVDLLIYDINEHMKNKSLIETSKRIEYLNEQLSLTTIAEIRVMFSSLIQEQYKKKMLAKVSDEIVFETVNKSMFPEEPVAPSRVLIFVISFFIGGFLGALVVLLGLSKVSFRKNVEVR